MQPTRVGGVQHRVAVQAGANGLAVALGIAQHGIQQALEGGLFQLVDAGDGLANRRVGRDARVKELVQADQQQGFDVMVGGFEGFLQQLLGNQGQAWLPAGGAEGQVLSQAAIARVDPVQQRRQAAAQRSLARQHRG